MSGKLFYGDNLKVLKELQDESVDLIYLDPPFNSNANYNVLFKEASGEKSASQITAFEDTWHWTDAAEEILDDIRNDRSINEEVKNAIEALVGMLKRKSDMSAYLVNMTIRLCQLHRILKSTGSIYLHCDPAASHYLKILMDKIFGPENFKNEIIWRRTASNNSANRFGPIHQSILFYGKTSDMKFYYPYGRYTKEYVKKFFKYSDERGVFSPVLLTGPGTREGDSGKPWRGYDPTTSGRHWQPASYLYDKFKNLTGVDLATFPLLKRLDELDKIGMIHWGKREGNIPRYKLYLNDAQGVPLQDIWAFQPGTQGCVYGDDDVGIDEDVKWISASDNERLGYPTQKPVGLLERIIKASSKEGDIILDPFCGCGTTVHAAEKLKRNWIGIDITHLAIRLIKRRLSGPFPNAKIEVRGEPTDVSGAEELFKASSKEFETWAISLVGATPVETDEGRDGIIRSSMKGFGSYKGYVQVKGGEHLNPGFMRDFIHTVNRDKANYGIFITLREPTEGMRQEALKEGFVKDAYGQRIPKIQLITIRELLEGKEPQYALPPQGFGKQALKIGLETKKQGNETSFDDFSNIG